MLCVRDVKRLLLFFTIPAVLDIAGCTTADYSDGVNNFSKAVTATAGLGTPLSTAAQQVLQAQMMQSLATVDPKSVSFTLACNPETAKYTQGDCAVTIADKKVGSEDAAPELAGLTKYAALLAAVVADQTCASLQTDAKSFVTLFSDIAGATSSARNSAAISAAATKSGGAIASLVSTIGCMAIDAQRLSILRGVTEAADPVIQQLVVAISIVDVDLQQTAVEDAYRQMTGAFLSYNTAMAQYAKSKSAADLAKAQSSLAQAVTLATAIDKSRSAPAKKVVEDMGKLHQTLTEDLKSPTVSLKRVEADAQTLLANAAAVSAAITTLTTVTKPATKTGG